MNKDCTAFFARLAERHLLEPSRILFSGDGFQMAAQSLSSMLETAGITTFPGRSGRQLLCRNFFDDWYFYAVTDRTSPVYSLVKLREQEYDLEQGLEADGDTPGVTISFVAFDPDRFLCCLEAPTEENRRALADEINRVVVWPGQAHHAALKAYFLRPQSRGAYLIARSYVRYIASLATDGRLPVPVYYRSLYADWQRAGTHRRIPAFLEANNRAAGYSVCDHAHIFIRDPGQLSLPEELAILATHTGNVSFYSFAAEVCFHAKFLTRLAKLPLPFVGSPYASALRADMSVQDREFQGPKPYYRPTGRLVRQQMLYHRHFSAPENETKV